MVGRFETTHGGHPLWQEALDLAYDICSVKIIVDKHAVPEESWKEVAFSHLARSHQALKAIYLLSTQPPEQMQHPVIILVRSLFELSMDLEYMYKNPKEVPNFLANGRPEENDASKQLLQDASEGKDSDPRVYELLPVPKGRWKTLWDICKALRQLNQYYTFYRVASQEVHGGAYGTRRFLSTLGGDEEMPDRVLANVLYSALVCYVNIVNINLKVFPFLNPQFANFQSGTDWFNRLVALRNAINEEVVLSAREALQQRMNSSPE